MRLVAGLHSGFAGELTALPQSRTPFGFRGGTKRKGNGGKRSSGREGGKGEGEERGREVEV